MSTRRTSQLIENVEVKLAQFIRTSQLVENVEVHLPPFMRTSQVLVNVEVEIAYRTVTFGPRLQGS